MTLISSISNDEHGYIDSAFNADQKYIYFKLHHILVVTWGLKTLNFIANYISKNQRKSKFQNPIQSKGHQMKVCQSKGI